jgi:hypothetical protein
MSTPDPGGMASAYPGEERLTTDEQDACEDCGQPTCAGTCNNFALHCEGYL